MTLISEAVDSFKALIFENGSELIKNPIIWILLGLILAGVYALFNVSEKTRQNGLGNVLRQLIQIILDVTSELLDLLRSLMGFISVLQTLLFGKLNRKTLYILTNFAIVYLSAASFTTTLTGLSGVVGLPVAVFISFGIQVSILICSMEIQKKHQGKDEKKEYRRVYMYRFRDNAPEMYDFIEKKEVAFSNRDKKSQENKNAGNDEIKKGSTGTGKKEKNKKEKKKKKKRGNWIKKPIMILLLIASVLFSSFFSYLFMFEKFVEKNLVYDDHFRAITVSHEIIVKYSQELNSYRARIVEILEQYNDVVEERLNLRLDNPGSRERNHENTIETLNAEIEALGTEIEEAERAVTVEEAGTDAYFAAIAKLNRLTNDQNERKQELRREEKQYNEDLVFQNRLRAYKSIMDLSSFYANAANLQEGDEERFRQAFIQLQQAEAALENEENNSAGRLSQTDRLELTNTFETYMTLSKYFTAVGTMQVNFSEVQEAMNFTYGNDASDENAEEDVSDSAVLDENAEENASDNSVSGINDGKNSYKDFSDEDYMEKSNEVLRAMLNTMNELPVLGSINNIWSNQQVLPPDKTYYLDRIFSLYRDNNGTVMIFERAINKLAGRNGEKMLLAVEMAVMALMVDGAIVWLIFLRGRGKNFITGISDTRRLLSLLFVEDSEEKETVRIQKEQSFCATMGVAAGVLTYVLYRMKSASQDMTAKEDIFSFVFFSIVGLILGLVAQRFYSMVLRRTKKWEDEEAYIQLKKIWLGDVRDEKEWNERIDMLKKGKLSQALKLSEEAEKRLRNAWKNEHEQRLLHKYFSDSVNSLFEKIQEKECTKYIINKELKKGKVVSFSGIKEKMVLPCLAEEDVKESGLKTEFAVLKSKHIIGFDIDYGKIEDNEKNKEITEIKEITDITEIEGIKEIKVVKEVKEIKEIKEQRFYILTEKFWNLLYDTILLKLVGSRVSKFDIEEELYDGSEEDDED